MLTNRICEEVKGRTEREHSELHHVQRDVEERIQRSKREQQEEVKGMLRQQVSVAHESVVF